MATDVNPRLARYAEAARQAGSGSCGCGPDGSPFGAGHYDELAGVPSTAVRASMGCGNPTAVAELRPGDIVLDLGSGGGLDVLLSARRVGPTGFVYGLDATAEMIDLARNSATAAGVGNVEFLHGTIEEIPLDNASVDVVISNCVIVLSTDKRVVCNEIARVLRPGGRTGISDIVRVADDDSACAVDCAATAISVDEYEDALRDAGLGLVTIERTEALGGGLSNAIVKARKRVVTTRAMTADDWPAVRTIYEAGIATGNATFETGPPSWDDWDRQHLDRHRVIATTDDGTVVGWAALSPVSDRCAYSGVAESSVYVADTQQGRGVGTSLLDALIHSAERDGHWTIQTGILPENTASLALHERLGFRIVGRRERLGQLNGTWRDVYLLERRSPRY
jgi:L-amino acid N-acyltransferase YncA/2-polyprenyl-3-methyl-5-hydroxy-6-metoxy-1,4-benzoquinol methylase